MLSILIRSDPRNGAPFPLCSISWEDLSPLYRTKAEISREKVGVSLRSINPCSLHLDNIWASRQKILLYILRRSSQPFVYRAKAKISWKTVGVYDQPKTKLSFPQQQVLVLSDNGTASTSLHVGTNRYEFIEQQLCTISLRARLSNWIAQDEHANVLLAF